MNVFTARPALRWTVPGAIAASVVAVSVGAAGGASAEDGLPEVTAQELVESVLTSQTDSLSGTITSRADLGLPALPMNNPNSAEFASMVSGSHTLQVWMDGPDRSRVALMGPDAESDLVRNGEDVWVWSSSRQEVIHAQTPVPSSQMPSQEEAETELAELWQRYVPQLPSELTDRLDQPLPAQAPSTPQEVAELALALAESDQDIAITGTGEVAGRASYRVVVTPTGSATLVDRIVLDVDGETFVPLRSQVYAVDSATGAAADSPAIDIGFTDVSYDTPDADRFAFTAPPGATVVEAEEEAREAGLAWEDSEWAELTDAEKEAQARAVAEDLEAEINPQWVGNGWSSVVVGDVPAELAQVLAGAEPDAVLDEDAFPDVEDLQELDLTTFDAEAMLAQLPERSGDWGSGRVLESTLMTAVLTDDGRLAYGAVPAETIFDALSATTSER